MIFSYWTRKLQRLIHTTDFKLADKYLGLFFGATRGFFFAVLFYIFLLWFISDPDDRPEWIFKARFRPYLISSASYVVSTLPSTSTFDEIKFLIRLDSTGDAAQQSLNLARENETLPENEIGFDNVKGTSNRAKSRMTAMEIRVLQNSLKSLRDAEEIQKQFIKELP
jgi:hypothetical protein